MVLKYYYDLLSQPSRAIYIFLKLNNIPFEKYFVNLSRGEQKREDFKKINPFGLVPVINDDGFVLRESVGILRYLSREKNLPEHWYPRESKAQAKADEFIEWQHLGLRMPLALYVYLTKIEPLFTQKPLPEAEEKKLHSAMVKSCDLFEKNWLRDDKKFLFGDKLSIADLLATMELEQSRMTDYDPRKGRPKLASYMERVRANTNPYYDEALEPVDKLFPSKL